MGNELTLYQAAAEYAETVNALMSADLDETAISDTLHGEIMPIQERATATAFAIRNLQSLSEQIKAAEAQMAERRKKIEARAERIENYLHECLKMASIEKIETPHFEISIKRNPTSVEISDPAAIPSEYMRNPPPPAQQPDKKAIKAAIEQGVEVPGASLIQNTRIEIK